MSDLPTLSHQQARRLLMSRQGLMDPVHRKITDQDLLGLITRMGFVQLDSIQTVARAHHMILFARNQTYKPKQLTSLLEKDRHLFEHWTHDAAVIPTEFYPYWRHKFARERERLKERWQKWRRDGFLEVLDQVHGHVRETGPTMARDLGQGIKKPSGGWWDWHPEKTALEYHWRTGALSITGRQNFQKLYDLTEHVIPEQARNSMPDHADFVDWACRSALSRLGTATSGEIAAFWDLLRPAETAEWCRKALQVGELVEVAVTDISGKMRKSLARPDIEQELPELAEPLDRLRILSPFDPLIRDRKRLERLFGFDYRIEIFVPEAKRKYGYYVFPILEKDRFIGRIDMKHHKDLDALKVTGLWLEPGIKPAKGRLQSLEAELERHRRFVGAGRVIFADGYLKAAY